MDFFYSFSKDGASTRSCVGYSRQIDKRYLLSTIEPKDVCIQVIIIVYQWWGKIAWSAKQYCVRLGPKVYFKIMETLHEALKSRFKMSYIYHPQTDG